MTLIEFIAESKNDVLNNGIKRSVKKLEDFEVKESRVLDNWYEIDVYGIKSKSKAMIRVVR